jgi:hypothetical protein
MTRMHWFFISLSHISCGQTTFLCIFFCITKAKISNADDFFESVSWVIPSSAGDSTVLPKRRIQFSQWVSSTTRHFQQWCMRCSCFFCVALSQSPPCSAPRLDFIRKVFFTLFKWTTGLELKPPISKTPVTLKPLLHPSWWASFKLSGASAAFIVSIPVLEGRSANRFCSTFL